MNAFRTLGQKWAYNTGKGRGSINLSFYRRRKSKRRAKTDGPLYSGDSSYNFPFPPASDCCVKQINTEATEQNKDAPSPPTPLIECANKYEKKQQKGRETKNSLAGVSTSVFL